MNTQEIIKDLITKLPISDLDKQHLLQQMETEGEEPVRQAIKKVLEKVAVQIKEKEQIDQAVTAYDQSLKSVEQEAEELYTKTSKEIDTIEMDDARQTISGS